MDETLLHARMKSFVCELLTEHSVMYSLSLPAPLQSRPPSLRSGRGDGQLRVCLQGRDSLRHQPLLWLCARQSHARGAHAHACAGEEGLKAPDHSACFLRALLLPHDFC